LPTLNEVNWQKPRQIAAQVLARRRTGDEYTETCLERALASARLSAADRGLCHELVFGVVRWQATLDWLIGRKTQGRTQKLGLQELLRLGLYQIFWLDRIPDHAAVHETVEMAKLAGYGPQSGFVNAILRGYLREVDETRRALAELKTSQPALGWSHPEWLVERWRHRFGDERTQQLLAWNNTPPKTFARVNTLRTDATKLVEAWREEGVDYDFVTRDWIGENLVFELKTHPQLITLESFRQGWFYIQDPSTLLAVRELDPQPGETILDLCAAPGGKTTFIAQLMNNQGRIVARDLSPDRIKLIEENCTRLGVNCVELSVSELNRPHADPLPQEREQQGATRGITTRRTESDSRPATLPLPGGEGRGEGQRKHILHSSTFDRVLVDAPCSNTGVLRRRVDLRWRIQPQEIERLRTTQLDLLHQAVQYLKPGGVLVYSTCSLEPEENAEVVKQFLATHAGFKLERERDLLPFTDAADGAYVARVMKTR
jgi:16S rRNA (cytosine967-C5)-methyltransferase